MADRVKVDSRHQILVPPDIREKLGISPGDDVLMVPWDDRIVLFRRPEDYVGAMDGLHREIWKGIDPQEYVRGERELCQSS